MSPQKSPNIFRILPKWQNFAQNGHTAQHVCKRERYKSIKVLIDLLPHRRKCQRHSQTVTRCSSFASAERQTPFQTPSTRSCDQRHC